MAARTLRRFTLVAGSAWLVVAGYGLRSALVDGGDEWELTYSLFMLALIIGTALSVAVVASVTGAGNPSSRLRTAGLLVNGFGVLTAVVAWALPLWMTVSGVGFAIVTLSSTPPVRRAVGLLAAGQLGGLAVLFLGLTAHVGRQDEWGDYPAAHGAALVVAATVTIVALIDLSRSTLPEPATAAVATSVAVDGGIR